MFSEVVPSNRYWGEPKLEVEFGFIGRARRIWGHLPSGLFSILFSNRLSRRTQTRKRAHVLLRKDTSRILRRASDILCPASPSSSGLGHRPFKAVTRVRVPLGAPESYCTGTHLRCPCPFLSRGFLAIKEKAEDLPDRTVAELRHRAKELGCTATPSCAGRSSSTSYETADTADGSTSPGRSPQQSARRSERTSHDPDTSR